MASKSTKKDYSKLDKDYESYRQREYYGVIIKKGRISIDTKRFLKFFKYDMPKKYDFSRSTVYLTPKRKHYTDYCMSYFIDAIEDSRNNWYEEKNTTNNLINDYKKKKLSEPAPTYDDLFFSGVLEPDEWQISNNMEALLHSSRVMDDIIDKEYSLRINLYSQAINNIASHLEHAMVITMNKMGFKGDKVSRRDIFAFMDGRIGDSEVKIKSLEHWKDYDKFYSIWNFTKHNSKSTYEKLLRDFPDLLYVKGQDKGFQLEFPSEMMAIHYLKIDEKIINRLFDPLLEFYYEFCELCYGEKKYDANWNYEDFFLELVDYKIKDEIDLIENPLGIPPYI